MKGTKLIGMLVAMMMVGGWGLAQKTDPNKTDLQAALEAYRDIKGDVEEAARVQAMFEALPQTFGTVGYIGFCLRIQSKDLDALDVFNNQKAIASTDNEKLAASKNVAVTLQRLKEYQQSVDELTDSIERFSSGASDAQVYEALNWLSRGLVLTRDYSAANTVAARAIVVGFRVNKNVSPVTEQLFARIRPEYSSTEEYTTILTDILKATPATEANAEFLGRVKSELEKMR